MLDNEKTFGRPPISDARLWLDCAHASDVTDEEYDEVYELLQDQLDRFIVANKLSANNVYFRGDNFGDRTQYLEVEPISLVTSEVCRFLQRSLLENDLTNWRILIPGSDAEALTTMVIYTNLVRFHRAVEDQILQFGISENTKILSTDKTKVSGTVSETDTVKTESKSSE